MQPLGDTQPSWSSQNPPLRPVLRKILQGASGGTFPAALGKQREMLVGRRSTCLGAGARARGSLHISGWCHGFWWAGCVDGQAYGCSGSLMFSQPAACLSLLLMMLGVAMLLVLWQRGKTMIDMATNPVSTWKYYILAPGVRTAMEVDISLPSCASPSSPKAPRAGLMGQTLLLRFWAAAQHGNHIAYLGWFSGSCFC